MALNIQEFTVNDADDGIRLDRWFKRHHPGVPHAWLEKALRKGLVRVNDRKAKSSDRIATGHVIRMPEVQKKVVAEKKPPRVVSGQEAREIQALVLYKDANVIAINKPAGLAVQGGSKQEKHLDGMLDALRFDGQERPKLVHRLDQDTSGVLLLARSAKAAHTLTRAFADKETQKIYWALVMGLPIPREGEIDLPLSKRETAHARERVVADAEEGKKAITYYKVLEELGPRFAWVELQPLTGRTHQLRVHMAELGTPIIGDGKYGGEEAYIPAMKSSEKLHLHARRIRLPRELFGKAIDITAPLPPHMKETWAELGLEEN